MKIAMIGGTGQLGHFVMKHLSGKGHELTAIGIGNEPEAGFLPAGTKLLIKDTSLCSLKELEDIFKGIDVVIHGAGADGRDLFDKPAIEGFRKANVESIKSILQAMKNTGSKKLIILGSYYTAMHRAFPLMDIPSKSAYIKSRVEQIDCAFAEAGDSISVGIMELPYIFGAAPNRPTLWGFYIDMLQNAQGEVPVHAGGSACITMNQVGVATANACEIHQGHKCYPIGNVNLKYKEMMEIFAGQLGLERKITAMQPDYFIQKAKQQLNALEQAGKESAYDPIGILELENEDFFIDPTFAMTELSYGAEDINSAIKESIDATLNQSGRGPGVLK